MKLFCLSALYSERAINITMSIYFNLFAILLIVSSAPLVMDHFELYEYLLCPAQYFSTLLSERGLGESHENMPGSCFTPESKGKKFWKNMKPIIYADDDLYIKKFRFSS